MTMNTEQRLKEIMEAGYEVKFRACKPSANPFVDLEIIGHVTHKLDVFGPSLDINIFDINIETLVQKIYKRVFQPKPMTNKELLEKIERWTLGMEYHRIPVGIDMNDRDEGFSSAITEMLEYLRKLKEEA